MDDLFKLSADKLQAVDKSSLRFEWVTADAAKPNDLNWRVHPEKQSVGLNKLIFSKDGVGWAGVLLINERRQVDGWDKEEAVWTLVDGHDRRRLAALHNQPAPAIIGHWTPEQERTILSTLDPIAALAETNADAWANLLQSVESTDSDIQSLLDDLQQRAGSLDGIDFGGQFDESGGAAADNKKDFTITLFIHDIEQFELIAEKVRALIEENSFNVTIKA